MRGLFFLKSLPLSIAMLSFSLVVPANSFASPFSKSDLNDEIIFNLKHTSSITNKEEKVEFEYSWALPAATLEAQGSYPVFLTLRRYVEDASFLDIDRGLSPLKTKDTLNSFQKTRFLRAIESYKKGHGYLEWQRGPFLFRQYYMAPGELLTFSGQHLSGKKQTKTYYKQERYSNPQETSIEEVYSDSHYQLEYWHDQGEWVVELPYEEGGKEKRYAERFKAIKRIKKSFKPLHAYERDEKEELVYNQPRQFAYPPYRLELERREAEEFLDTQPQLTKAFLLNALLLSGGIVDGLRSSSFVSSTSSTTAKNSFNISDWIFYPSSSWIPYASLASVLIPSQPHFMGPKLMPFALSILSLFGTTEAQSMPHLMLVNTNNLNHLLQRQQAIEQERIKKLSLEASLRSIQAANKRLEGYASKDREYLDAICGANNGALDKLITLTRLYDQALEIDNQAGLDLLTLITEEFNKQKEVFEKFVSGKINAKTSLDKESRPILESNEMFFHGLSISQASAKIRGAEIINTKISSLNYVCDLSKLVVNKIFINQNQFFEEDPFFKLCKFNDISFIRLIELAKITGGHDSSKVDLSDFYIRIGYIGEFASRTVWYNKILNALNDTQFTDTEIDLVMLQNWKYFNEYLQDLIPGFEFKPKKVHYDNMACETIYFYLPNEHDEL